MPQPVGATPHAHTVQVTGSSKNIGVIIGWTKEDMMKVIDDVEYNGYYMRVATNKYGIAPTSMHHQLNGLIHTKGKMPLTVITGHEEEEAVSWCKDIANIVHGIELIQLNSNSP